MSERKAKAKRTKAKNQFDFNCAWLSGINSLRKYVKAIILIFISLLPRRERERETKNNNLCVSTTWVYNIRDAAGDGNGRRRRVPSRITSFPEAPKAENSFGLVCVAAESRAVLRLREIPRVAPRNGKLLWNFPFCRNGSFFGCSRVCWIIHLWRGELNWHPSMIFILSSAPSS